LTDYVRRLAGLDGIRGLAALYVVAYHVFLRAFPGPAAAHAPAWVAVFGYGRFAVVVFLVLSGFALGVAPARDGWRLGGLRRYARRRAWRILPAYWAALVFSLLMTWLVLAQPGWPRPDGKSVLVNGLLLQGVVDAPSPNRAFWSIAVEAELYLLLPLILLACRRLPALAVLGAVTLIVVAIGVVTPEEALTRHTPDLLVLFATGLTAAGVVRAGPRVRAWPWPWFAAAAAVPVLAWIAWAGPDWTQGHLFWVDLGWAPAIGCLLVAVATERPKPLVRLLDSAPLRGLGSFSYSLYLTHLPIVLAVSYGLVAGRVPTGVPMFLVLLGILLPLTVAFARLFAAVFELPFVRHRGWPLARRRPVAQPAVADAAPSWPAMDASRTRSNPAEHRPIAVDVDGRRA
jgi:peptidoglycan/LPS O-acetylase OafA/YrhL